MEHARTNGARETPGDRVRATRAERKLDDYFPEAVRTAEQIDADEYRCVKCGAFVFRDDRLFHLAKHEADR